MSSKSFEPAQNFHYRLLLGCLEAVTLVMANVLVIPRPEVRRSAVSYPLWNAPTPFENGVILARLSPASVGQICP